MRFHFQNGPGANSTTDDCSSGRPWRCMVGMQMHHSAWDLNIHLIELLVGFGAY
jgi:hypothetical protein